MYALPTQVEAELRRRCESRQRELVALELAMEEQMSALSTAQVTAGNHR